MRVLAVGQHDDVELRRRALAAGATFAPYRRMTGEGADLIDHWMTEGGIREPAT